MLGRLAAWLADWRDGWLSSDADAIPIPGCQRQSCGRRVHSWSASREILCLPPAHPETKPSRFFSLPLYSSHALSLSLCTLSPVSWSSSALFPPLFPSAVNRSPNSPASLFSGEHRLTPLPPPLPSFHRVNASNAWRPEFRVLKSWTGPVSSQFDELVARREEGGGFDEDFLRIGKLEYSWDVFARYDFSRERW